MREATSVVQIRSHLYNFTVQKVCCGDPFEHTEQCNDLVQNATDLNSGQHTGLHSEALITEPAQVLALCLK